MWQNSSEKSLLMQYLGDTPEQRVIDFFLENRSDYSRREIMQVAGMSKTGFNKLWDELVQSGTIRQTRKYGKVQLYALNESNRLVKKLVVLYAQLSAIYSPG